jgi:hypothetical protein
MQCDALSYRRGRTQRDMEMSNRSVEGYILGQQARPEERIRAESGHEQRRGGWAEVMANNPQQEGWDVIASLSIEKSCPNHGHRSSWLESELIARTMNFPSKPDQ